MANDPHRLAGAENPSPTVETAGAVDPKALARLPFLPVRDVALFPGISGPLAVGQEASVRLVEDALAGDMLVCLVAQRNPSEDKPQSAGVYTVGTVVRMYRAQRLTDGTLRVLVQGLQRIKVFEEVQEEP